MQINEYNIITPWDSINTNHTWKLDGEYQYVEITNIPSYFYSVDFYLNDIISFLLAYIIILGIITFLNNGRIHRKNKTV